MLIDVAILEVATWVVHRGQEEVYLDDEGEPILYSWQEGNDSCDCNRWIKFSRYCGRQVDISKARCGEGAYFVRLSYNGKVLYDEIAERSPNG